MRVEVRPANEQGRLLTKKVRVDRPPSSGNLKVYENRLHRFGRVVTCAVLTSSTDGVDTMLLPELLDVELLWAEDGQMRLRGVELVDNRLYGQTWDVKVL